MYLVLWAFADSWDLLIRRPLQVVQRNELQGRGCSGDLGGEGGGAASVSGLVGCGEPDLV